jgi:cytoskeleton-associated protein 5
LLLQLSRPLTAQTKEDSFQVQHAELILKCIWKRSRTAEDDFRKGLLDPGPMMEIIEGLLIDITPKEWRQRAQNQVPLGDMALRTIKVLIQHILSE